MSPFWKIFVAIFCYISALVGIGLAAINAMNQPPSTTAAAAYGAGGRPIRCRTLFRPNELGACPAGWASPAAGRRDLAPAAPRAAGTSPRPAWRAHHRGAPPELSPVIPGWAAGVLVPERDASEAMRYAARPVRAATLSPFTKGKGLPWPTPSSCGSARLSC